MSATFPANMYQILSPYHLQPTSQQSHRRVAIKSIQHLSSIYFSASHQVKAYETSISSLNPLQIHFSKGSWDLSASIVKHTATTDGTEIEEKKVENASEAAKGESNDDSDLVEKPVLDYGLGYGDFCFSGPSKWRRDYLLDFTEGSNMVALPEIGSFKRSGYFDFEKLPIDIRRHFFRLLVAPLYQYKKESRRTEMPIVLACDETKTPPSRRGKYMMYPLARSCFDFRFFELIRHASNVSKSFRKVLADALWEQCSLKFRSNTLETTFGSFVEDRPAACAGVKELSFKLWCASGRWCHEADQLGESYIRFCSLASKLRLENLTVTLLLFNDELLTRIEEIMAERGEYATISGIRQINVSENFNLRIEIQENINLQGWTTESTQKVEDLEEKYQPMIRVLMMPTSLAKKIQDSETSEVGQYLRTRLE